MGILARGPVSPWLIGLTSLRETRYDMHLPRNQPASRQKKVLEYQLVKG